ncbi:hypothetical protein R5R35_002330 [Gryllus longicercus]|uniref:Uncharacterized protein n=1 Tax=Gryllus longicercus TaxID=2509291 RepID=A0AAN9Z7B1_9ORTH
MPPRRLLAPKTLEELCLNEIVQYLTRECLFCTQVKKYQKSSLLLRRRGLNAQTLEKELESYLDILPPLLNESVRQHITNEVLNATSGSALSQQDICVSLLAIVLNKDVKTLEFRDEAHASLVSPIWPIVMKKCTGLKRFVMADNTINVQTVHHLQPILKIVISNCQTLTELILKNVAQGFSTMSMIGRTCSFLKLLDITGSRINCMEFAHLLVYSAKTRNINIEGVINGTVDLPLNPMCSTLEVLLLADTEVKVKGAALAVKMLPNLTSMGNFVHLAAGLKFLYGTKAKPPVPLKITQAKYYGPSHNKLRTLANCCPNLDTLNIGNYKHRELAPSLMTYKHLKNLTLENVEFEAFLACTTLLPQLIDLKLTTNGIDVGQLGMYCINLENLWLCGEPLRIPSRPPNCQPFVKLKKLKMQCLASAECVGYIVRHATGLKVIDLYRVKDLNDKVFAKWFQWNPLQYLETLMIRYADITRETINLLLENCPNLTRLGELGGWDIRSWERRRISDLVLRQNYKLHLVLCSRNADSIIIDILNDYTSSDDELGH